MCVCIRESAGKCLFHFMNEVLEIYVQKLWIEDEKLAQIEAHEVFFKAKKIHKTNKF